MYTSARLASAEAGDQGANVSPGSRGYTGDIGGEAAKSKIEALHLTQFCFQAGLSVLLVG